MQLAYLLRSGGPSSFFERLIVGYWLACAVLNQKEKGFPDFIHFAIKAIGQNVPPD